MPDYDVAHLCEQGQDMLLFPLDGTIHNRSDREKADVLDELERRAHAAGLAGRAAILWDYGGSGYSYGPREWQSFLQSIDTGWVWQQVNRNISW